MFETLLILAWSASAPTDTLTLTVPEAFQRGLDASPVLTAAGRYAESAKALAEQANAWPNPTLSVSAENVGQQWEFTGLEGPRGLEGQAVLRTGLPLGSQRSGTQTKTLAEARIASAERDDAELALTVGLVASIGSFLKSRAHVESAHRELETLELLSSALTRRAEEGRSSEGDAARASLALGTAATRLARREANLGYATAQLARLLGYPADTPIAIDPPACAVSAGAPGGRATGSPSAVPPPATTPPRLVAAEAEIEAARGSVDIAHGLRMPDLLPEVGVRRTGGLTGLYLGLSTSLPLFDRGGARMVSAEARERAAAAEHSNMIAQIAVDRVAAGRTVDAFARAGSRFDQSWFGNAELAVTAADARYRLGEGTLTELLDSRRARLEALDDYATWQSEWWNAQAQLAYAEGRPADPGIVCLDPFREVAR